MTNLEITKLCAEAIGLEKDYVSCSNCGEYAWNYEPLHDDAQAMALVKKLYLSVYYTGGAWQVETEQGFACDTDLNRAICECVAKMQQAKQEADKRFGQPHFGHNE